MCHKYSLRNRFLNRFYWQKWMLISLYLLPSKYIKMHQEGILSIGRKVLEFSCVPLYTEFLSDLYEKFQVSSLYDANVECQIRSLCYSSFLSYSVLKNSLWKSQSGSFVHIIFRFQNEKVRNFEVWTKWRSIFTVRS